MKTINHIKNNLTGEFSASSDYSYGFNGMEKDDSTRGKGNIYTTLYRILDVENVTWLSTDPLVSKFPWQTSYSVMDGNPIYFNKNVQIPKK